MTTRTKRLEAMAGRPLRLVAAAARDPKKQRDAGGVTVTQDVFAILDDPDVHVVVEVIGGTSPARDLQLAAFERGKHVVTANKELVAKGMEGAPRGSAPREARAAVRSRRRCGGAGDRGDPPACRLAAARRSRAAQRHDDVHLLAARPRSLVR